MARPAGSARRYAEAAFELARSDGKLDAWLADLRKADEILGDASVQRGLDNPAVPFGDKREALERLLAPAISRPVLNLVLLLIERDRASLLRAVVDEYVRRLNRERGIMTATLTSAAPLDDAETNAVRSRLEQLTGARIELTSTTDASLIGGLTVRVGDRLIDASVRGRLERLRERLVADAG